MQEQARLEPVLQLQTQLLQALRQQQARVEAALLLLQLQLLHNRMLLRLHLQLQLVTTLQLLRQLLVQVAMLLLHLLLPPAQAMEAPARVVGPPQAKPLTQVLVPLLHLGVAPQALAAMG